MCITNIIASSGDPDNNRCRSSSVASCAGERSCLMLAVNSFGAAVRISPVPARDQHGDDVLEVPADLGSLSDSLYEAREAEVGAPDEHDGKDLMQAATADPRFEAQFSRRLMQVFLYVTDECNLRCEQCYYKPWLKRGHVEMPDTVALALLRKFRDLGAIKVTFLGGEPTLYGQDKINQPLGYLVQASRQMGFEYIRIVTNGTFSNSFLEDDRLKDLNEITFSIDGDTPEMHNKLRGRRSFERAIDALRAAVNMGFSVHITMCVHRGNVGTLEDGMPILGRAIEWAEKLGVRSVNFHPLLRMGVPRDGWTGETDITPIQWVELYSKLSTLIESAQFRIPIRIPTRFLEKGNESRKFGHYDYCSVRHADRLDVHPNGQIHICALHTGTPITVASFERLEGIVRIKWTATDNEVKRHQYNEVGTNGCPLMSGFPEQLQPLCVSYKPGQKEIVWNRLKLG